MEFFSFLCLWVSSRVFSSTFQSIYLTFPYSCVSMKSWFLGQGFSGGFFLEYYLCLVRRSIALSFPLPSISPWAQQQTMYLELLVIHSVLWGTPFGQKCIWQMDYCLDKFELMTIIKYGNSLVFWFIACIFKFKKHEILSLKNWKNVNNFGFLGLWGGVATVLP